MNIKRTTFEEISNEVTNSGRVVMSIQSTFVAQHRSRPFKKIVITSSADMPSGLTRDGFGTLLRVLNQTMEENLEKALLEELNLMVGEFMEGKISLKTMGNDSVILVYLNDSIVDCSPNECGLDSWFSVLSSYTPLTFMDDLAARLMQTYAVDVSIIDGKKGGLVLRHN